MHLNYQCRMYPTLRMLSPDGCCKRKEMIGRSSYFHGLPGLMTTCMECKGPVATGPLRDRDGRFACKPNSCVVPGCMETEFYGHAKSRCKLHRREQINKQKWATKRKVLLECPVCHKARVVTNLYARSKEGKEAQCGCSRKQT
jgi:hypothetical protein